MNCFVESRRSPTRAYPIVPVAFLAMVFMVAPVAATDRSAAPDPEGATIGFSLTIRFQGRSTRNVPMVVYLARVEEGQVAERISSEPSLKGRYVFLNVRPGRYRLDSAGLYAQRSSAGTGVSAGSQVEIPMPLTDELTEKTIVDVGQGELVFMGEYLLRTHHRATIDESPFQILRADRSSAAAVKFWEGVRKTFRKREEWLALIDATLAGLGGS